MTKNSGSPAQEWSLPDRPIWKQALIDTIAALFAGVIGGSAVAIVILCYFAFVF